MTDSIPTATERRKRHHEAVVEDILTIAREMMRADGVAALSFNAIARQLGMKPPSLYTYFPSKDAIYDELFRRGFIEFGNRMRLRPNINGPFADSLRSAFETYLTFAQENPDLYQIMFQRPVPGFEPSDASMAVSLSRLADGRRQLQALIELGTVAPPYGLDEASDLVIGLMHGLTELHLANNPDLPVGQGRFGSLMDQAVQLFVDAWATGTGKKT